jgi:hypothetical protein
VALLALLISAVGGLRVAVERLDEPTALECRCDRTDDGLRVVAAVVHPEPSQAVLPMVSGSTRVVAAIPPIGLAEVSASVLLRGSAGGPRAP